MKTIYTLLLAFGLCFTVHAQSTINIVNYQMASSQVQNQINALQQDNPNRLLLQDGFSTKQLSNDNNGIKLIKVVDSNSISDSDLINFGADYSKVKIIVFSKITANSPVVHPLNLTALSNLEYVIINSDEVLTNTFIQNLFQNVQLPSNVTIVYKQNVLM